MRHEAEKLVDVTVERLLKAGVIAEREIDRADSRHVAAAIALSARDFNADLVVLGSRGLSDWQSMTRHSVSHELLCAVDCPLLIVRGDATAQQKAALRHSLGLDRPVLEQYVSYLTHAAQGDLGISYRQRVSVSSLIATRLPNSLELAGIAFAAAISLGFALGVIVFHMKVLGSLFAILLLGSLGAVCFGGIGLLTASRAQKIESVSGLMNLVMMPMWIFSGVFFSYERFPAVIQPLIKALPLTALNDALRASILEGTPLIHQWPRLLVMAGWGNLAEHIAVLSPTGFTPMVTFDPVSGSPEKVVDEIVTVLERLRKVWS